MLVVIEDSVSATEIVAVIILSGEVSATMG